MLCFVVHCVIIELCYVLLYALYDHCVVMFCCTLCVIIEMCYVLLYALCDYCVVMFCCTLCVIIVLYILCDH